MFGTFCGENIIIANELLNWTAAIQRCEGNGGTLGHVGSDHVREEIHQFNPNVMPGVNFWLPYTVWNWPDGKFQMVN